MQRNPVLRHSTLALAMAAMLGSAPAWAEYNEPDGVNTYIWDQASVTITGNEDNSGATEGVFIRSNAGANAGASFQTNGNTSIFGTTVGITGANNNITGTNTLTGATSINASANYATNINTGTSTGNVTVGNANNTTSLNSATNNIGVATIGVGGYATTNNIGTGAGVSTNRIGNTNVATKVTARAGNSELSLENDRGSMAVTNMDSKLTTPTQTVSGGVVVAETGGVAVDANGALAAGGATGPTTAMVMENGYGQVNGLVVTESQATVSGGAGNSSSLTLSDRNARFSNAATGRPITVTGVADGEDDFDAVNVRQFAGAIASVTAQANIPALAGGQNLNLGVGLGHFMGKSGMALGMNWRVADNALVKATVSSGLNSGSEAAVGVGASIGW